MKRYEQAEQFIVHKLKTGLPSTLSYHGPHHVDDVLNAAVMLAEKEDISPGETELLKVAVLYHDSGFIISERNHEQSGCAMAKETLPQFGYTDKEIELICGMIMATKFPHHPKNHLEEIICDADLDYLGRDDFFTIGNSLFKELTVKGAISGEQEWNEMQENFLTQHKYFTKTAIALRQPGKQKHLEQIRKLIAAG